jgi:hypothetical protein
MGIVILTFVCAAIVANLVFTILLEIKGAASKVKHLLLRLREYQTCVCCRGKREGGRVGRRRGSEYGTCGGRGKTREEEGEEGGRREKAGLIVNLVNDRERTVRCFDGRDAPFPSCLLQGVY